MGLDGDEKRHERKLRRQIVSSWKDTAKTMATSHKSLQKEMRREGLAIIEEAARTETDFEEVAVLWDEMERIERWRIDKHEKASIDELLDDDRLDDALYGCDTIIPIPINHAWWRQLLAGDFLDFIHDCPYEMHELTASSTLSNLLKTLNENQTEVLYYRTIRQWSFQRIAAFRGQTDRNILKVYDTLINKLRKTLYKWLFSRYIKEEPLTLAQREFIDEHYIIYGEIEEKKTALDKRKKQC